MEGAAVSPMSRQEIRARVREFRETVGCKNKLYFPIVNVIEEQLPLFGFEMEIEDDSSMGDAYAITDMESRTIRIRESTYVGAIQGNARDRFTLCHEVGHCLLHTPDRVIFARGSVPLYMRAEWQANTFAGELMAPPDLVRGMDAERIAEKCGMSRQAAKIQWSEYRKRY
ncbi:MAG: ImmA/IrrE family metallo-endopeptidase [Eubacteriales bacterium]|nr:ImmA/IrrE family metallo-endopeptidase [Eubacteriales bacterium]